MTGTYAGQFVMGGFLKLEILQWQRVLLTRVIALGPALAVTVAMGNDIRATDRLSAWLNVLQCLQLPFAVIPLLLFCARCPRYPAIQPSIFGLLTKKQTRCRISCESFYNRHTEYHV